MFNSYKEAMPCLKAIINADSKPDRLASLVSFYANLQSNSPEAYKTIADNFDYLEPELASQRRELVEKLGVTKPGEKKAIVELFDKINFSEFQDNLNQPDQLIAKINRHFQDQGITFQLSTDQIGVLTDCLKKIKILGRGLQNINLLRLREKSLAVFPYSNRYITMTTEKISDELNHLYQTIINLQLFLPFDDKIIELATEALLRTGHLKVSLENKDPVEMMNTVYYEAMAAKSVLDARRIKGNLNVSKSDILDAIARNLLEDEKV